MVAPWGAWLVAPGACVVAPEGHVWLLGGHAWLLWEGHVWLLGGVCVVALGEVCGCSGGCAWYTTTHGDTVNELAVRILLECILVSYHIDVVVTAIEEDSTFK